VPQKTHECRIEQLNQSLNQSINQYIYNAPWYRAACYSADYAEAKRNVLSRVLNVLTDGAVRQFRGREFQSLGAATEKRRAAVSIATEMRWNKNVVSLATRLPLYHLKNSHTDAQFTTPGLYRISPRSRLIHANSDPNGQHLRYTTRMAVSLSPLYKHEINSEGMTKNAGVKMRYEENCRGGKCTSGKWRSKPICEYTETNFLIYLTQTIHLLYWHFYFV